MNRMFVVLNIVVLAGTVAVAGQQLERINPPGLSSPISTTYSHIVKAGKLVFIAGQVGITPDGKIVSPGMKEQVEQVMKNLQTALASQGLNFSHVAKINIFTTNVAEFRSPEVAEVRAKYFGQNLPVSTLVQIQQLAVPEYKVEIEATAVIP